MHSRLAKSAFAGARYGFLAWVCYALIEFVLYGPYQVWSGAADVYAESYWSSIGILFAAYAAIGIAGGALAGVVVGARSSSGSVDSEFSGKLRSTVNLTLLAVFALNAATLGRSGPIVVSLATCVGLGLAQCLALGSASWRERLLFTGNPWANMLAVIGPFWISHDVLHEHQGWLRTVSVILFPAVVVVAAAVIQRLTARWPDSGWAARQALACAVVAAGALAAALLTSRDPVSSMPRSTGSQTSRPSVLLIVMDSARADHMSLYGYRRETTPNLRKFAREATVYSRAFATSDMTLPTHASMFTGLYPGWHGAHHAPRHPIGRPLAERFQTLAEVLSSKGYFTAGVAANSEYLRPSFGLSQGFQAYLCPRPVLVIDPSSRQFFLRRQVRRLIDLVVRTSSWDCVALPATEINDIVAPLLARLKSSGRPFF